MMAPREHTETDEADRRKAHSERIKTLLLVPIAAGLIMSLFARLGLSFFDSLQPNTLDHLTALFSAIAWGALFVYEAFGKSVK